MPYGQHLVAQLSDAQLDELRGQMIREHSIRAAMAEIGSDRQTVADMLDAMESMGQEAVLDLTDGEPTTLRDALQRYVEGLETGDADIRSSVVIDDLTTILAYPWPGPSVELEIVHRDEDHLEVRVGGMFIFSATQDDHGRAGLKALENASRAVHREVTTRLGSS